MIIFLEEDAQHHPSGAKVQQRNRLFSRGSGHLRCDLPWFLVISHDIISIIDNIIVIIIINIVIIVAIFLGSW